MDGNRRHPRIGPGQLQRQLLDAESITNASSRMLSGTPKFNLDDMKIPKKKCPKYSVHVKNHVYYINVLDQDEDHIRKKSKTRSCTKVKIVVKKQYDLDTGKQPRDDGKHLRIKDYNDIHSSHDNDHDVGRAHSPPYIHHQDLGDHSSHNVVSAPQLNTPDQLVNETAEINSITNSENDMADKMVALNHDTIDDRSNIESQNGLESAKNTPASSLDIGPLHIKPQDSYSEARLDIQVNSLQHAHIEEDHEHYHRNDGHLLLLDLSPISNSQSSPPHQDITYEHLDREGNEDSKRIEQDQNVSSLEHDDSFEDEHVLNDLCTCAYVLSKLNASQGLEKESCVDRNSIDPCPSMDSSLMDLNAKQPSNCSNPVVQSSSLSCSKYKLVRMLLSHSSAQKQTTPRPLVCREEQYYSLCTAMTQILQLTSISSHCVDPEKLIQGQVEYQLNIMPSSAANPNTGCFFLVMGPPGTGKTETVSLICQYLCTQFPFELIELNAMKMSSPSMFFSFLWFKLNHDQPNSIRNKTTQVAKLALDEYFKQPISVFTTSSNTANSVDLTRCNNSYQQPMVPLVLVLDELELLLTPKQEIFYTLFEWINQINPRRNIVVIGITNMMDLSDNMLPKIQSRMGSNNIIFHPYQASQLEKILSNLLEPQLHLFSNNRVLNYLSKVVCASRGDMRLAFELCCRAVHLAELEAVKNDNLGKEVQIKVDTKHVDFAMIQIENNPRTVCLRHASHHQKLWCIAVLIEIGRRQQIRNEIESQCLSSLRQTVIDLLAENVTFFDLAFQRYQLLCQRYHIHTRSQTNMQGITYQLAQMGIFSISWQDQTCQRGIYLDFDTDEMLRALNEDPIVEDIAKNERLIHYFK